MRVEVAVQGPRACDELGSLWSWLLDDEDLRGRVEICQAVPVPGTMGTVPDVLLVALGGVGPAFATVLVTWLRTRVGSVRITLTPRPGCPALNLHATNVRGLDATGIRCQIAEVVRATSAAPYVDPGDPPEHSTPDRARNPAA
jgi:hypothetical protein